MRLHNATSQMEVVFILAAVRTSHLTNYNDFVEAHMHPHKQLRKY
jgi:hypothetical protein